MRTERVYNIYLYRIKMEKKFNWLVVMEKETPFRSYEREFLFGSRKLEGVFTRYGVRF